MWKQVSTKNSKVAAAVESVVLQRAPLACFMCHYAERSDSRYLSEKAWLGASKHAAVAQKETLLSFYNLISQETDLLNTQQ